MPVVRRIRNRGATITVESHAEVLFMPGGSVNTWANRFTGRIRAATIAEAPVNKRPRWAHYGKPLKATIVSARPRFWSNGGDKQRVYAAVGATAPHAYYVDQGTGVYAGGSAYQAKILPPWERGSASLYEATWRAGGPSIRNRPTRPVYIKGQKGQGFFDKGLRRAFTSMRMRSYQVPGDIRITDALNSVPTGLANFAGNTPADAAFIAQLEEWRQWRDDAWARGEMLGRDGGASRKTPKPKKPSKPKPPKKPSKPKPPKKPTKPPKKTLLEQAIAAAKREMAAYKMRHPQARIAGFNSEGFLVIWGTGQQKRVYWSMGVADLFADAGAQHSAPSKHT